MCDDRVYTELCCTGLERWRFLKEHLVHMDRRFILLVGRAPRTLLGFLMADLITTPKLSLAQNGTSLNCRIKLTDATSYSPVATRIMGTCTHHGFMKPNERSSENVDPLIHHASRSSPNARRLWTVLDGAVGWRLSILAPHSENFTGHWR